MRTPVGRTNDHRRMCDCDRLRQRSEQGRRSPGHDGPGVGRAEDTAAKADERECEKDRRIPATDADRQQGDAGERQARTDHDERIGPQPLAEPPGCRSNIYKYIALLPAGLDRARFKSELAQRFQVKLSGEVYDLPLHRQPVLAEYAGPPLPVAEELAARHICLPVHSDMTDGEVDEVLAAVAAVHGAFAGR